MLDYPEFYFRQAWATVSGMFQIPSAWPLLLLGCGRDAFAYEANQYHLRRFGHTLTPGMWRLVLEEAVRRGWLVKGKSEFGYTTFKKSV